MKRLLLILLSSSFWMGTGFAQSDEVRLTIQLKTQEALVSLLSVDSTLHYTRLFPVSEKYEARHVKAGLHLWYKVSVADSTYARSLINTLSQLDGVKLVRWEQRMDVTLPNEVIPVSETSLRSTSSLPVNDPLYPKQWHYQNRIYPHGVDINLEKAWKLATPSRDVVVAVMDQCVDHRHPDLAPNMWVNEAELNGKPGVDDDGNGYVDDVYGYAYRKDEPFTPGNHGTHVAGTIAAVNNNGLGVCGIAGGDGRTTGVRLMNCYLFYKEGVAHATDEEMAQSFVYAADNGAVISSNSWTSYKYSDVVVEAVNYFIENAGHYEGSPMKGGLVIWGAGNDHTSEPCKPGTDPRIHKESQLIVASVGPDGSRASYSNYGDWVDVAAPGGEFNYRSTLSTIADGRYGYAQGTSMACPHVTGVAALIVSKYKGENLTSAEVKRRVISSVRDVNQYVEGQFAWHGMGAGIVDAERALLANQGLAPEPVRQLWTGKCGHGYAEVRWVMPEDKDDLAIDSCLLYVSEAPISEVSPSLRRVALATAGYRAGDTVTYHLHGLTQQPAYVKVQAKDRWGQVSDVSPELAVDASVDKPLIVGDYLFNRFSVFQYSGKAFPTGEQDSLFLTYSVLAPASMAVKYEVSDAGKALSVTSFADGKLNLLLAPEKGQLEGEYAASIKVYDAADPSRMDSVSIRYCVNKKLVIPNPLPRQKAWFKVFTDSLSGTVTVDLNDYFEDPSGEKLYYDYFPDPDKEESDFTHTYKARLEGSILTVDYAFNLDSFDDFTITVPVAVTNLYEMKLDKSLHITYKGSTANESIDVSKGLDVYPNPVENVLYLRSSLPIEQVYLYSMGGYLVYQRSFPGNSIDLSYLSAGTYLLQIRTKTGMVVKKIIKR